MKKARFFRRLKSMVTALRDYFVEEEPRDKARRTMKDVTAVLQRVIYQRVALEFEATGGHLDGESQHWCDENLKQLCQTERAMTEQLSVLRQQYRTLMLKDLYYSATVISCTDALEQVQAAMLELEAAVEAERMLRSLPKVLSERESTIRSIDSRTNGHETASRGSGDRRFHDRVLGS